jgi:hypothetical protein
MTRPVHIRGGIYTPSELHRLGRGLDGRINSVNAALTVMRKGAALLLRYENGRSIWSLSSGQAVSAEVAETLTKHALIAAVGDSLFPDCCPSQTWRYLND